jgi:hypothetical protein
MSRLLAAGTVIYDQLDFYSPSSTINRINGIVVANLSLLVFVNNGLTSWPLADGTSIPDSSISSGSIYFNEIAGSDGYYNLRYFPNQIGFWRMIVIHSAYSIEIVKEYDIIASGSLKPTSGTGLNASFVRQ